MMTNTVTRVLRILSAVFLIGFGHPLATFPLKYAPGTSYRYQYATTIFLNEPGVTLSTAARRDVGFTLTADVDVTAIWNNNGMVVFKLEVVEPRLQSISRSELTRDLPSMTAFPMYFQWESGRVSRVFISEDDATLSANMKKGIISLFQLRLEDGRHSEVDVSGDCQVTYERINNEHIKKSKTSCNSPFTAGQHQQVNEILGVNVTSSSHFDYVISNDIIHSIVGEETTVARINMEQSLASSVRVRQDLTYKESKKASVVQAPTVDALIKKISKKGKPGLYGTALETTFEPQQCTHGCTSVNDLVSQYRELLDAQFTGTVEAAEAFNRLVEAFRGAPKEAILEVLKDKENQNILLSLLDVTSAAQTAASQSALMELLNFNHDYDIEAPERYLLATALATHPTETVLSDLLTLFKLSVPNEKLRESIGDALGAVVNTYRRIHGNEQHKIVSDIEAAMVEKLNSCETAGVECRLMIVRALSNARLPTTLPLLIKLGTTAKEAELSEAAIMAVGRMDRSFVLASPEVLEALRDIFYQKRRGYDSAVRTQALKILLSSPLSQDDINAMAKETLDPWNTDYSLYIQARLFDAAQRNDTVRFMLKQFFTGANVSNYHVLAPKGKSLAFTSLFADTPDIISTYHMYVENGRTGIMKRSGMDVNIISDLHTLPVYSFNLFAAGLEALLGEEVDETEKNVDVTAGLALDLVGVSLRPITFFVGQTGLMSAIWSAPSELTPALQTSFLLQDHSERFHLGNGMIAELNVRGALSLGLAGSLSVSLWNKNSKSLIKNSGGMKLTSSFSIQTPTFRVGVEWNATAQSNIDFKTDVDFYDGVVMCLQMSRPAFIYRKDLTKFESCRGFKTQYRTRVSRLLRVNAVSYPLPRRNAENCRKINPAT